MRGGQTRPEEGALPRVVVIRSHRAAAARPQLLYRWLVADAPAPACPPSLRRHPAPAPLRPAPPRRPPLRRRGQLPQAACAPRRLACPSQQPRQPAQHPRAGGPLPAARLVGVGAAAGLRPAALPPTDPRRVRRRPAFLPSPARVAPRLARQPTPAHHLDHRLRLAWPASPCVSFAGATRRTPTAALPAARRAPCRTPSCRGWPPGCHHHRHAAHPTPSPVCGGHERLLPLSAALCCTASPPGAAPHPRVRAGRRLWDAARPCVLLLGVRRRVRAPLERGRHLQPHLRGGFL